MQRIKSARTAIKLTGLLAAMTLASGACVMEEDLGVGSTDSFEEFEATVFQEEESGLYIVDGDTPIRDIDELRDFYEQYVRQGALAVYNINGTDIRWNNTTKRNLTYCVSQQSFGSRYSTVVTAMRNAAAAWENAANVRFIHVSSQDGNCTSSNGNVLFDVRQTSTTSYLARAFFPNYSRSSRNILISTTAFNTSYPLTLTGILRHELGHVLGFRHEHTRPQAGTCFEDNNYRALTYYDSASVMHYPQCNGTGDWSLVLTTRDRQGAAALYGSP